MRRTCKTCRFSRAENRERTIAQLYEYIKLNGELPKTNSALGQRIYNNFGMGPYDFSISQEFLKFKEEQESKAGMRKSRRGKVQRLHRKSKLRELLGGAK